jgi:hypothetical protein
MNFPIRLRLFLTDVAVTHFACVLFGASFFSTCVRTLLFSLIMVFMAGVRPTAIWNRRSGQQPIQRAAGPPRRLDDPPAGGGSTSFELCEAQMLLTRREQLLVAAAMLGSLLAPLDWNVWWQEWPLPSLLLVASVLLCEALWRLLSTQESRDKSIGRRDHVRLLANAAHEPEAKSV